MRPLIRPAAVVAASVALLGSLLGAAPPSAAHAGTLDIAASDDGTVVLDEAFDGDSLPSGWTVMGGSWAVADGVLTGGSDLGVEQRLNFDTGHLDDFRVEARFQYTAATNDTRWSGLVLDGSTTSSRVFSTANSRVDTTGTSALELNDRTEAGWNYPPGSQHALATAIGLDHWVTAEIVVRGGHAEWWLDGAEIFEVDNLARSADGTLGLVYSGVTVVYDEITVTDLSGVEPPPASACDDEPTVDPAIVLHEDFCGDALPAGFRAASGSWTVQDGRLVGTAGAAQNAILTFGAHLGDYRFDARVRFDAVVGGDATRWQALALDLPAIAPTTWTMATTRAGTTAGNGLEFATFDGRGYGYAGQFAAPSAMGVGAYHDLSVVVHGSYAEWWFDGALVDSTDTLGRSADGVLGLIVNSSTVSYDALTVTRLDPYTPPAPCWVDGFVNPGQTAAVVIAHRGDSYYYPENTMPSFQAASDLGADVIEFDLYETADGVPVVIHDSTVDRTTDGTGDVRSMTLAQVEALDAGSWKGAAFAGTRIPTLREVTEWIVTQPRIRMNIELKEVWTAEMVGDVKAIVQSVPGAQDRMNVLHDFDATSVGVVHDVWPEIATGVHFGAMPTDTATALAAVHAGDASPSTAITKQKVHELHAAGYTISPYTFDDEASWAQLTAIGVDGMYTDRPGDYAAWRDAYRASTPAATDPCATGVTVTSAGHGTASASEADPAPGAVVVLTAVPDTGYALDRWEAAGVTVAADGTFTMPDAAVDVTAVFAPIRYAIAYDLGGGEPGGPDPTSYTIESAEFALAAPTRDGFDFAGWTGTGLVAPTAAVAVVSGSTGDRSYVATWAVRRPVAGADGGGLAGTGVDPGWLAGAVVALIGAGIPLSAMARRRRRRTGGAAG